MNQNDAAYQRNLRNFFGEGQHSKAIRRLTFEQAYQDPRFQQNLIRYFAADDTRNLD